MKLLQEAVADVNKHYDKFEKSGQSLAQHVDWASGKKYQETQDIDKQIAVHMEELLDVKSFWRCNIFS